MNLNLHGAFYTPREAARPMRRRAGAGDPGGSMTVAGSLAIFHGIQEMEHYAGARRNIRHRGPGRHLALRASKFQTGDILVIDGGRRVKSL